MLKPSSVCHKCNTVCIKREKLNISPFPAYYDMESFGVCLCGKPISWESSEPGVPSLPLESSELLRSCRRSRDPMLCESAISRWATPYIFLLFLLTHPFLTDNLLWVVCGRERSFCPEVFRANKGVVAVVGEFLATPARWYAPRIKWRLTQNSCSRSITNCGTTDNMSHKLVNPLCVNF